MKTSTFGLSLLLLVIFMATGSLLAQDEKSGKNSSGKVEINISVSDIFTKSLDDWIYYEYYDYGYYLYENMISNPKTRVNAGLKLHTTEGAFRFRLGFHSSNDQYMDTEYDFDKYKIGMSSLRANLGYEWHMELNKVTILYGLDIFTGLESFNYNWEDADDKSENKMNLMLVGGGPFIGVNYFITPKLSIGTEMNLSFQTYSGKSVSKYESTYDEIYHSEENETKYGGSAIIIGPKGFLSINIYL